ncbi:MAG: DUF362 domain-containing protein [Sorangiineae bacterium]|nr:DUF362 domain-containing protein [Polyangiaceae bacterium]MEB2322845.1 DUF362 domain-containing protein [Sorangiineae bacterium]
MSDRSRDWSRRHFLGSAAALAGAASFTGELLTAGAAHGAEGSLVAAPPPGFTPLSKPGRIVQVTKGDDLAALMQQNQLWPKPEIARAMLEKALTAFTGAGNLESALGRFIHADDVVAVKLNGIAGQSGATMAVNFELVLPLVEGLLALGVPAGKITIYEQFGSYMNGTRTKASKLPKGVKLGIHGNADATMRGVQVCKGIETKYVRFLTEATAVINMTQMKDHSICGYTGCLKNVTHGSITNPSKHHAHRASPQIAELYAHDIVRSRVRLHITDAFKIIYDQGPLDKNPARRILHGAVYVSTDPVAMDVYGWGVIDRARQENGLKSLAAAGREPSYLRIAGEKGLGVFDLNAIKLTQVSA